MVRSKQGTQTPRFLKCYSAVLLFPVKIVSQILQALQFTWHNEDKLLGRNPEVLENWISGSSKKEKTTPQNSKSKNSIYWRYRRHHVPAYTSGRASEVGTTVVPAFHLINYFTWNLISMIWMYRKANKVVLGRCSGVWVHHVNGLTLSNAAALWCESEP